MRMIRSRKKTRVSASKHLDDYQRRERSDALQRLGFHQYATYLRSSLWKGIRQRVIEKHEGKCKRCQSAASQVHHSSYDYETLAGNTLIHLHLLCGRCHTGNHCGGSAQIPRTLSQKTIDQRKREREKLEELRADPGKAKQLRAFLKKLAKRKDCSKHANKKRKRSTYFGIK